MKYFVKYVASLWHTFVTTSWVRIFRWFIHLSLLKWMTGVNKRTSTIPITQDDIPLEYSWVNSFLITTTGSSFLTEKKTQQIVRHAFVEQRNLELTWFRTSRALTDAFDPGAIKRTIVWKNVPMPNSQLVRSRHRDWFQQKWEKARRENKKLAFYNEIKSSFGLEPYLSLPNHKKTRCITWLRTSSHKHNIETGRYGWKNSSINSTELATSAAPKTDHLRPPERAPSKWHHLRRTSPFAWRIFSLRGDQTKKQHRTSQPAHK